MKQPKAESVMLAQNFKAEKHYANSWYASEKLDGIRCFWDGGVSRGHLAANIPWCNAAKHARFRTETRATGLWTRYLQPIQAPDWFLNQLPPMPLDGELWTGPGQWQKLSSIVKQREPDARWSEVQYLIFDAPSVKNLFGDRVINNPNLKIKIQGALDWVAKYKKHNWDSFLEPQPFYKTYALLGDVIVNQPNVRKHEQVKLDYSPPKAIQQMQEWNDRILAQGGEGLILRSPVSAWVPYRSWDLLKFKTTHDMEGTVIGYKFAKETDMEKSISGDKTDKLLGLMGSVRLKLPNGKELSLSGFTHEERQLHVIESFQSWYKGDYADAYGAAHAGEDVPSWIGSLQFPRGSRITFKYRELSDDGCPKEARYLRKHEEL